MSTKTCIVVHCDECGTGHHTGRSTEETARLHMKSYRWMFDGERDVCRKCVRAARKELKSREAEKGE